MGTTLSPAVYNQVNMGFVNAYVLVRGNEVAVIDTGLSGSEGECGHRKREREETGEVEFRENLLHARQHD